MLFFTFVYLSYEKQGYSRHCMCHCWDQLQSKRLLFFVCLDFFPQGGAVAVFKFNLLEIKGWSYSASCPDLNNKACYCFVKCAFYHIDHILPYTDLSLHIVLLIFFIA